MSLIIPLAPWCLALMASVAIWRLCSGPTNDRASHGLALGPCLSSFTTSALLHPPALLTTMLFLQLLSDAHGFCLPFRKDSAPTLPAQEHHRSVWCHSVPSLSSVLLHTYYRLLLHSISVFVGLFSVPSPASIPQENDDCVLCPLPLRGWQKFLGSITDSNVSKMSPVFVRINIFCGNCIREK